MNNNVTIDSQRIKIERRYGDHYSYFVDANGILKGKWGGFDDLLEPGPNGEAMFEIYYTHFSRRIPINEFGFFYNKFSCKKYDGILKLPKCELYICEKNGRFGLIDADEKCLLHTTYNEIKPCFEGVSPGYGMRYLYLLANNPNDVWEDKYKDNIFFIVTTETGKFIYNLSKKTESAVYDDIFFSDYESHPQIIYKNADKYGALDIEGNVLLKPYFDSPKFKASLFYNYQDLNCNVWVEGNLLYGKIPVNEYDVCFRIGSDSFFKDGYYYIVIKDGKYGLISKKLLHVSEPELDEIVLYKPKHQLSNGCLHITISKEMSEWIEATLVIAREGEKYKLFNVENGHLILNNCDSINYKYSGNKEVKDIIEFTNGSTIGYVLWDERIVCTKEYESVNVAEGFIFVKKEGKCGVIRPSGDELFPCIYDNIQGSRWGKFILFKDDKEETVNIYSRKRSGLSSSYERPTYERYAGSYAQDEAGYSDDEIDTIFDGDPSAYWNID